MRNIHNIKHIDELCNIKVGLGTLGEHLAHVVLNGSAALALNGIRSNDDIDAAITDAELWDKIVDTYPGVLKTSLQGSPQIDIGSVSLFFHDILNDFSESVSWDYTSGTEMIGEFTVWGLVETLEWKRHMGRDKDLADIKLIKAYWDAM